MITTSATRRARRKKGLRKKIFGSAESPRLSVFRSSKHIYAQLVDDYSGKTLVSSSSLQLKVAGGNIASAQTVGADLAAKAKQVGVAKVAFDRNGYKYHGRVKALADAAREGGLQF